MPVNGKERTGEDEKKRKEEEKNRRREIEVGEGKRRRERKNREINEQTIKYNVKNKQFLVGKKMHNKDNSSRSLPGGREHPIHRRK